MCVCVFDCASAAAAAAAAAAAKLCGSCQSGRWCVVCLLEDMRNVLLLLLLPALCCMKTLNVPWNKIKNAVHPFACV